MRDRSVPIVGGTGAGGPDRLEPAGDGAGGRGKPSGDPPFPLRIDFDSVPPARAGVPFRGLPRWPRGRPAPGGPGVPPVPRGAGQGSSQAGCPGLFPHLPEGSIEAGPVAAGQAEGEKQSLDLTPIDLEEGGWRGRQRRDRFASNRAQRLAEGRLSERAGLHDPDDPHGSSPAFSIKKYPASRARVGVWRFWIFHGDRDAIVTEHAREC